MDTKKSLLLRAYLIYALFSLVAIAIVFRVLTIQYVQKALWKQMETTFTTSYRTIEAVRGDIYSEDGSIIATSIPYYDVAMDVNTDYLNDELFNSNVERLSRDLSGLFKDRTEDEYYKVLKNARANGDRYLMLYKNASYDQLQNVKKFPLLKLGKYRGGLVITQTDKRDLPFRDLAERTIGFTNGNIKPVGIEGGFDGYLRGTNGQGLMKRTGNGNWVPVSDELMVPPINGYNVTTTINITYQDVAETALREQLRKHYASHGSVVLMEVNTGRILAIANLTHKDTGARYQEDYNYAVGESTEPGSTFKLFSLLVGIDDGYLNLNDTVNLEGGKHRYFDREMHDSHHDEEENGNVTLQRAFEISSNVGISKIIFSHYQNKPQKFIDGLCRLGLNQTLHLSIPGEGIPRIPSPSSSSWSAVSLPWVSIGYGVSVTPLQTLTIYNSIANNGTMVKPKFADALTEGGKIIINYPTEIINPAVCSSATLKKLRMLLESVVLHGTASNLNNSIYPIAGKTGTAQIARNGQYKTEGKVEYQASFVGYFPADKPKYSCIVVINSPSTEGYYGNIAAGPVFREIADKVYATDISLCSGINNRTNITTIPADVVKKGFSKDVSDIFRIFKINTDNSLKSTPWITYSTEGTSVHLVNDNPESYLKKGIIPDFNGYPAQDAIYLLENNKLRVTIKGCGAVTEQSIKPGTSFIKGQNIQLRLS